MKKNSAWEWQFDSEPDKLRLMVQEIFKCIDSLFPTQTYEDRNDLRLIFNELLANAIIHGNDADKNKKVHIKLSVSGYVVRACITDEGDGYHHQDVMAFLEDAKDPYRETGRGLQLVKSLADSIAIGESGKSVTFEKKIKRDAKRGNG